MANNLLSVKLSTKGMQDRVRAWKQRVDGTHPQENIKDVLEEFGEKADEAILQQYIDTYSQNPRTIARRTYRLENMLRYVRVSQRGSTFTLDVTNPSMWPLGSGVVWYSALQEFGSEAYNVSWPARSFILAGDRYIGENFDRVIKEAYARWKK